MRTLPHRSPGRSILLTGVLQLIPGLQPLPQFLRGKRKLLTPADPAGNDQVEFSGVKLFIQKQGVVQLFRVINRLGRQPKTLKKLQHWSVTGTAWPAAAT